MADDVTQPDLLRRAAAERPDDVAVAVDDGEQLTYAAWQRRSGALARGLRRWGVQPGDRVAVCHDSARWTEHAVACLAVHKASAAAVPLDAGLGRRQLCRVLADASVSALLTPAGLAPGDTDVAVPDVAALEAEGGDRPLDDAPAASDGGEVLYTCRPLSSPRSMTRSHAELACGPWRDAQVGADAGAMIHAFPPGTRAGQDAMGASLHPDPARPLVLPAFDVERLCGLLARQPHPGLALHPATARALLDSDTLDGDEAARLRVLVLAAGRVRPELLVRLGAAFPQAELVAVDVLGEPGVARTAFRHDHTRPGSLGRVVSGPAVAVADDDGRPLDRGELGGVRVSGEPTAAAGYLDPEGCLYQVSGSHEVTVGPRTTVCRAEVEAVLVASPGVVDAAVLGMPDDRAADELAAAVVLAPPHAAPDLRARVADRLGGDKAPDSVAVVDELPRNPAGVLLRRPLRRRLAPASDDPVGIGPAGAAEPGDPAQEAVAAAWRRVLRRRDVGPDDDFFELGGGWDDVAALVSLLEDATGVALSPSDVAAAPTVAGVAGAVARRRAASSTALTGGVEATSAPVAGSQQGMLWHEHFVPGCQNLPGLARRLRGPLDVHALERALDEIVRRHGALRTAFALRSGRLTQVVAGHRGPRLPVRDLRDRTPDEREAEVERLATEAGQRPFDLVTDELFVPTLLRLAEDEHVLLIRTHHSVFDDWSVGVFRHELAALYPAYANGEDSPLPEPPVQFTDFSRRRRERLAGPAGARELSFWRRELSDAPLAAQLPLDDPERPEGSPQPSGEPVSVTVAPEAHQGLRTLAQRERATVFMATLAGFGALVQRYTGQGDLVLATVVANRNRTEHEGLIGCFTKKVPVRLRLSDDPTFAEALSRTRGALLGALTRQDLPFEDVVQDTLGPPAADHGLVPHLALMFQGVTSPQELSLPGLHTEGLQTSARARRTHFMAGDESPRDHGSATQPWGAGLYLNTFLILSVDESAEGLTCSARGAFHAAAARDLMDSYATLLADAAADPTRRLSALAALDGLRHAEVRALGRGPTSAAASSEQTLPDALEARVRQDPESIAVSAGREVLTFRELDLRANRLAHRLQELGAGPARGVGLALPPSVDAAVAALATWKAGAVLVGLDLHDTGERLARIAEQAAVTVVVTDETRDDLADHARLVGADADEAHRAATPPATAVGPDDAAVACYGSGRSDVGDGVVLTHRAVGSLRARLRAAVYRWPDGTGPTRRVCLSARPTDDAFLRQLVAVLDGHSLLVPDRALEADPEAVGTLLAAGAGDLVDCTPGELAALVDARLPQQLAGRDTALVEPALVLGTREGVAPEQWATLRQLGRAQVHVLYGPPSCAFAASARTVADAPGRSTVGRPLADVTADVLDARGRSQPSRALGELHVNDASRQDQHVGSLRPTGQLARRLPDGDLELLGSREADTDLRGFRVDPARVSAALARCPGVGDVAVTLERDASGEPRLVATLTPEGQPPTLASLRTFLWETLPGYAWPAEMALVDAPPQAPSHAPPLASALASLWGEVLDVPAIRASTNYWQAFSFLEVLDRARDAGVAVAGKQVTRNRTVAALAADLAAHRSGHEARPRR